MMKKLKKKQNQILKIRLPNNTITVIEECYGRDYIPPQNNNPKVVTTYIVKKGDNLYSIAKKYNTTTSAIMMVNNLPNTNLQIGQQLKIPGSNNTQMTPSSMTYIVKNGDNLYQIAKKFNTTIDSIKKKNNLMSNNLQVGQKLII